MQTIERRQYETVQDTFARAGMLDRVTMHPAYHSPTDGPPVEIPNTRALVTTRGTALGAVGASYHPFDGMDLCHLVTRVQETTGARLQSVAKAHKGRTLLAFLEAGRWGLGADDIMVSRLTIQAPQTGGAIRIYGHEHRIVCQNVLVSTFRSAESAGLAAAVPHFASLQERLDAVVNELHVREEESQEFREMASALASTSVTQGDADSLFEALAYELVTERGTTLEAQERREHSANLIISKLRDLQYSPTNRTQAAGHTAWGVYNAMTEYVDHGRRSRVKGADKANRNATDTKSLQAKQYALMLVEGVL